MNKKVLKNFLRKKIIVFIILIIVLILLITFLIVKQNNNTADTITYQGETYHCLEYNMDIFTYSYNGNDYFEEDIIHPIKHSKWDMLYFNGDLFLPNNQIKEAKKYYADDHNYEWSITINIQDLEKEFPIKINKEELEFLYDMDNMKREETISFDKIEKFATLTKTSKDQVVSSVISLAYCKNYWYWKTEVMNDNDEEYIIKLPVSLNNKINNFIE